MGSAFKVGDRVRISMAIKSREDGSPSQGWGMADWDSVGRIIGIDEEGDYIVEGFQKGDWYGNADDLELI